MARASEDVVSMGSISPATFLEPYRDRIRRYIRGMMRDDSEAEDLAQETFLRAYAHQTALRDPDAALGWLYRIATRVTLDRLRQKARSESREYPGDFNAIEIADRSAPPVLKVIEQKEMTACVQGYIGRLANGYRAVILLHDLHGLTAQEIAHQLKLPVATVKIRIHRARRKLQAQLQAGCDFLRNEAGTLICEPKA
jgi:RNA polymerase sigma-70 factor (ECF subfamily)